MAVAPGADIASVQKRLVNVDFTLDGSRLVTVTDCGVQTFSPTLCDKDFPLRQVGSLQGAKGVGHATSPSSNDVFYTMTQENSRKVLRRRRLPDGTLEHDWKVYFGSVEKLLSNSKRIVAVTSMRIVVTAVEDMCQVHADIPLPQDAKDVKVAISDMNLDEDSNKEFFLVAYSDSSKKGEISLYKVSDSAVDFGIYRLDTRSIQCLGFDKTGRYLASTTVYGFKVNLWKVTTGAKTTVDPLVTYKIGSTTATVNSLNFEYDFDRATGHPPYLLCCSNRDAIHLLKVETERVKGDVSCSAKCRIPEYATGFDLKAVFGPPKSNTILAASNRGDFFVYKFDAGNFKQGEDLRRLRFFRLTDVEEHDHRQQAGVENFEDEKEKGEEEEQEKRGPPTPRKVDQMHFAEISF